MFADLDPFLEAHRHRRFARARSALLFPFALARQLLGPPGSAAQRAQYLYGGKRMLWRALRIALRGMLSPSFSRYAAWSRGL